MIFSSFVLILKANEGSCLNLGKVFQQPLNIQNIFSTSAQQRERQEDCSSHLLIKPCDLTVTPCHAKTSPSDLQEEWCTVVSQTYDDVAGHRLLKPRDFTILLGPDANSLVVSSSEEDWFSATSYISADTNVPRVCLMKPFELKITRRSDYSSMSCSPDRSRFRNSSQVITTNSLNRGALLRPCNFGHSRSQISSSSKTSVGQDTSRYQVGLLRPSDITPSIPKNSISSSDVGHDLFSTFSLIKVTSMSLLRPCDITTSGSGNASSVLPAVSPQMNIPLARQLHLVRPCDLNESSSISREVTTYSSRRSEISPPTSSYFSASSHFLDNQWQLRSFLSLRITPCGTHLVCKFKKEVYTSRNL